MSERSNEPPGGADIPPAEAAPPSYGYGSAAAGTTRRDAPDQSASVGDGGVREDAAEGPLETAADPDDLPPAAGRSGG